MWTGLLVSGSLSQLPEQHRLQGMRVYYGVLRSARMTSSFKIGEKKIKATLVASPPKPQPRPPPPPSLLTQPRRSRAASGAGRAVRPGQTAHPQQWGANCSGHCSGHCPPERQAPPRHLLPPPPSPSSRPRAAATSGRPTSPRQSTPPRPGRSPRRARPHAATQPRQAWPAPPRPARVA